MTFGADARLSDVERQQKISKEQERQAQAALLRKDMDETFATAHGQRVLRWIMDQCGYQTSLVSVNPTSTEILEKNLIYNHARRNLYLTLRSLIHRNILIPVEHKGLENDVDIFS